MKIETAMRVAAEVVRRLAEVDCRIAEEDLSTDPASPWSPLYDETAVRCLGEILADLETEIP